MSQRYQNSLMPAICMLLMPNLIFFFVLYWHRDRIKCHNLKGRLHIEQPVVFLVVKCVILDSSRLVSYEPITGLFKVEVDYANKYCNGLRRPV